MRLSDSYSTKCARATDGSRRISRPLTKSSHGSAQKNGTNTCLPRRFDDHRSDCPRMVSTRFLCSTTSGTTAHRSTSRRNPPRRPGRHSRTTLAGDPHRAARSGFGGCGGGMPSLTSPRRDVGADRESAGSASVGRGGRDRDRPGGLGQLEPSDPSSKADGRAVDPLTAGDVRDPEPGCSSERRPGSAGAGLSFRAWRGSPVAAGARISTDTALPLLCKTRRPPISDAPRAADTRALPTDGRTPD